MTGFKEIFSTDCGEKASLGFLSVGLKSPQPPHHYTQAHVILHVVQKALKMEVW